MILDGTYDSSGLVDITRLVISNLHESKYAISDATYMSKIKNWKESTLPQHLRQACILVTITPW
jgi:hypothetical protein